MHISPVTGQFGPNTVVIEPREPSGGVAPYAVIPGQQVVVNITIYNAVNIYGYNLTIYFKDPSLLEFVGFRYMPFLDEPYTTKDVHPIAGKIIVYAKSEPPAEPVSGTGTLVSLIFNATKVGETLIMFDAVNCWIIMEDGTQKHPNSFKSGKLAVTNTKIAVEPEELSGSVGETVKANITVYNVVDLYGIEINVTWNPEILQPTRVQYQIPWKKSFELQNVTGPGWYALAVAGLTQPPDPYTGNYTFVSITYKVLKIGTTKIDFETSKLSDISANPIPHAVVIATFSNIETTIKFEPSSIVDASLVPGTKINVTLCIEKVFNLTEFNIRIIYPEFLNFSRLIFNDALTLSEKNSTIKPKLRAVIVSGIFSSQIDYSNKIEIAILEFNVTGYKRGLIEIDTLPRQGQFPTYLKDDRGNNLPFKVAPCFFMNWHNVGIALFELSSRVMAGKSFLIGEPIDIIIRIDNLGAAEENVTLTLTYEGEVLINGSLTKVSGKISEENVRLGVYGSKNSSVTLELSWNTTGLSSGDYVVRANVTIEVDDHDPYNNQDSKEISLAQAFVDVAVVNILMLPNLPKVNETLYITVVVTNLGLKDLTCNLTVYLDGNVVEDLNNIHLAIGSGDIFFLTLKISTAGRHVLNFTIPAVEGEEILDNNFKYVILNVESAGAFPIYQTGILLALIIVVVLVAAAFYLKRRKGSV